MARLLKGVGLSPGLGYGTAYCLETNPTTFYRIRIGPDELEQELERFRSAVQSARSQYLEDKKRFEEAVGTEHSYIIDAHLLMLDDHELIAGIERRIEEKLESPERAVHHVAEDLLDAYAALEDPFFQERSFDFEEVIDRLLANLSPGEEDGEIEVDEDLILVGREVGLSVLARLPLDHIQGIVMERAGETSHVAIIARAHQIPVVSAVEGVHRLVETGVSLLVDGSEGVVEIGAESERLWKLREERQGGEESLALTRADLDPCVTRDGFRIHLYANTEFGDELGVAFSHGAEGLGLFRTEFLYMKSEQQGLDEEAHFKIYRELAEACGADQFITIRTLDIAETSTAAVRAGEEAGALGLRGIRLSQRRPELFRKQVRAVVRAAKYGNLRLVLPMISSVDEVHWAAEVVGEIQRAEGADWPLPLGVLVEVPSAVFTLRSIASVVDFISVGTNDLIQYLLAAGRMNGEVSYLYESLHPAVLRALDQIRLIAAEAGKPAMICGEMAASPLAAAILVGLGYRDLSLTPIGIPAMKELLRSIRVEELTGWADELLARTSLQEITERAREFEQELAEMRREAGAHSR